MVTDLNRNIRWYLYYDLRRTGRYSFEDFTKQKLRKEVFKSEFSDIEKKSIVSMIEKYDSKEQMMRLRLYFRKHKGVVKIGN